MQVNPAAHPMKALRAQTNQTKSSTHVASHRLNLGGIHLTWNTDNTPMTESNTYKIIVNNENLVDNMLNVFNGAVGCGMEGVVPFGLVFTVTAICVFFSVTELLLSVPEIL